MNLPGALHVTDQQRWTYGQELEFPADYETAGMARLRREAHTRTYGNGLCTRPVELDCRMGSARETCSYFQTSIDLKPTPLRKRAHAHDHGPTNRAALFDNLIARIEEEPT